MHVGFHYVIAARCSHTLMDVVLASINLVIQRANYCANKSAGAFHTQPQSIVLVCPPNDLAIIKKSEIRQVRHVSMFGSRING